jgi:16S rRNA (adenine1518-N6/adenine1519-N6)-dimethyltransferase
MGRPIRYDRRVAPRRSAEPPARKALGQHFLRDSRILAEIAGAVRLPPGGVVVEVGPGPGPLTAALLDRGHAVVAVEIEERMVRFLAGRFPDHPRLRLVRADAREVDVAELVDDRPFVLAGNLPYFAANPIIRHFLESRPQPLEMVVMVQREVARRIAAAPGKQSLLGLSVYLYAEPEILFDVPPDAFDPPPQVWSSVLRLVLREAPLVPDDQRAAFFDLAVRTFKNPRKHLHNALAAGAMVPKAAAGAALAAAGIDPMRRPETLTIEEWLALLGAIERTQAHA